MLKLDLKVQFGITDLGVVINRYFVNNLGLLKMSSVKDREANSRVESFYLDKLTQRD